MKKYRPYPTIDNICSAMRVNFAEKLGVSTHFFPFNLGFLHDAAFEIRRNINRRLW